MISSGVAYQYSKEVFENENSVVFLKLGINTPILLSITRKTAWPSSIDLPLPGGVDPGLLRPRIGLQIPDPLGHVPQTTRQQPGVAVGRIDIAEPQLRVVALKVRAVRGSAAGAPPDLALHRARRGVELGGQIGTDRVIPHHVRCRVQIIQAQVIFR